MAKRSILPVFIPHAGCPNDCVFCNQRAISGQCAVPSPSDIAAEITAALSRLHPGEPPELAFYGGSFTAIPPEAQEGYLAAAQPFLADGRLSSIRISTRPDAIDPETLRRLRNAGVQTVELGAQSMDDGVLLRSHRGHTAADTVRAARLVQDAGFALILQMMAGLPGDSTETLLATGRQIASLRPGGVRIYPVVVLRGTLLEAWMHAGIYTPLSVEDAVADCAQLIDLFARASIPILRIGLNPSESLAREVVAGAYHPALGERCYARWYLNRLMAGLAPLMPAERAAVYVHPSRLSVAAGQHRANAAALKSAFPSLKKLSFYPADCGRDEIRLETSSESPTEPPCILWN